jgi:hypothetical protein
MLAAFRHGLDFDRARLAGAGSIFPWPGYAGTQPGDVAFPVPGDVI